MAVSFFLDRYAMIDKKEIMCFIRMVLMKKLFSFLIILSFLLCLIGCTPQESVQIATTTLPVYEFTSLLCDGTDLRVGRLVTENVSCLHDYTLQVWQMRMIEGADTIVISGGGLEDFLGDVLLEHPVIDASEHLELICPETEDHHDHQEHHHETDPHYWLSPAYAKIMAENICKGLSANYPEYTAVFYENLAVLTTKLDMLQLYGEETLANLSSRELITFHDGFSYFAENFDLTILKSIEEESGQEASAAELKELIELVREHQVPTIFTETNGSVSAADVIAAETGCRKYQLDMAMAGESYFTSMYHNIDTIKEALG